MSNLLPIGWQVTVFPFSPYLTRSKRAYFLKYRAWRPQILFHFINAYAKNKFRQNTNPVRSENPVHSLRAKTVLGHANRLVLIAVFSFAARIQIRTHLESAKSYTITETCTLTMSPSVAALYQVSKSTYFTFSFLIRCLRFLLVSNFLFCVNFLSECERLSEKN